MRGKNCRLFRNTGDSDVLRQFKIMRNRVTQSIREARNSFINMTLHRNKNNPRKFWRVINGNYSSSETVDYDGEFIDPVSVIVIPVDTISLFLNDYFANIGSHLNTLNTVVLDDMHELYPEMSDKD